MPNLCNFLTKISFTASVSLFSFMACNNQASKTFASEDLKDKSVQLFKDVHIYRGGGQNFQNISQSIQLPDNPDSVDTALLTVDLNCPNDRCDWWDRSGQLTVLDENGRVYELMRFKTPYRVGATWVIDVSDFLPLLRGHKEFGLFIDTWVSPGHQQGDGWLVSADLTFMNKNKPKKAVEVIPIFDPNNVEYGNPKAEAQLSATIQNKNTYKSARLLSYVTGHGQGNTENCAEFCPKNHSFSIGEKLKNVTVWRDDCSQTVTKGRQMGSWLYPRAGWCPGDKVAPIFFDISDLQTGSIQIGWKPESYTNNKNSDYDNNGHTMPFYRVSSYLILYR